MQFKGILEKIAKNLILSPLFTCLVQIWAPKYFLWILPLLDDIVASYYCMQFQGKRIIQIKENDK